MTLRLMAPPSRRTASASSPPQTTRPRGCGTPLPARKLSKSPSCADITIKFGSAAFSEDGKRVVTASNDRTARLWDAATGKEVAVLRGHDAAVKAAAFSPDGERVVTASDDKTARLWDVATGKHLAVLRHDATVEEAAFSPDGKRVVTASYDKTTRLWDVATGKEVAVLRGHDDAVESAEFSPDGKRVVTASDDKTARLWDATTGKQLAVLAPRCSETLSTPASPAASASWFCSARRRRSRLRFGISRDAETLRRPRGAIRRSDVLGAKPLRLW